MKESKKELKNIFDKHQKFAIQKNVMLPNDSFYNFLYIRPFKNFITEKDVELFVKNALIADNAQIGMFERMDEKGGKKGKYNMWINKSQCRHSYLKSICKFYRDGKCNLNLQDGKLAPCEKLIEEYKEIIKEVEKK